MMSKHLFIRSAKSFRFDLILAVAVSLSSALYAQESAKPVGQPKSKNQGQRTCMRSAWQPPYTE